MTKTLISLRQSEEWFWSNTPRKILAMLEVSEDLKKNDMKLQAYYIACMVWGQEIEEEKNNDNKKGIPGIDFPVNANLLKEFYNG